MAGLARQSKRTLNFGLNSGVVLVGQGPIDSRAEDAVLLMVAEPTSDNMGNVMPCSLLNLRGSRLAVADGRQAEPLSQSLSLVLQLDELRFAMGHQSAERRETHRALRPMMDARSVLPALRLEIRHALAHLGSELRRQSSAVAARQGSKLNGERIAVFTFFTSIFVRACWRQALLQPHTR